MADVGRGGRELGARLRWVRQQQGLSLADVEEQSEGALKAVVIGAYERGDRAVTITRLHRLARFYRVPMSALLTRPQQPSTSPARGVVLDLAALESDPSGPGGVVARFATRVQRQRGDHNGRVLSVRRSDVDTVALTLGLARHELVDYLESRALTRSAGSGA